jgi:hypothetical protein
MFETLEGRQLLSGSVGTGKGATFDPFAYGAAQASYDASTHVLTINNAHDVQISAVYKLDANGDPTGPLIEGSIKLLDRGVPGGTTTTFLGVAQIVVNGTKDYDIISASVAGRVGAKFYGGSGSDSIVVSNNGTGNVLVYGGNANDTIWADNNGKGTTVVYGEGGKDTFHWINGGAVFNQ